MMSLGDRPQWPFVMNSNSPQARNLFRWWPLVGTMRHDMVMKSAVLNGVSGVQGMPQLGLCPSFSGSSQALQGAVDLSPYMTIGVSFWMNTPSYTNGYLLAMEYTATSDSDSAFIIDPNSGAPAAGKFYYGTTDVAGTRWADSITRPTAGVFHHYFFLFDRTTPINYVWVDGVEQTGATAITHTSPGGVAFSTNKNLNVMSRNNASLFMSGNLTDLRIYTPNLFDKPYELVWSLFRPESRWSLYKTPSPVRRMAGVMAGIA